MTSTAPVKSHHQPLHNFSLPFLKWAHKNPHHRFSSPPHFPSTSSDSDNPNLIAVGSRTRTRFPFATYSSSEKQPSPAVLDTEKVCEVAIEAEESVAKPWNLRPRKNGGVSNMKNGESPETAAMKSMRLRGLGEGERAEKREKRKFWIALSKEEIEEDVYAMTGSKPARRPKKRPKNVQNQLDNVFPGLYLVGLTADSYRVHDALS